MSYAYTEERQHIFTEEGQVTFLKIRDRAKHLIETAGAASMGRIINGISGEGWTLMACVDRMVELHEIYEVPNPISRAGQHRIFTAL